MTHITKSYADNVRLERDESLVAPAAERNKEPIFHVLKEYLDKPAHVLEVASGTGQHVSFFAKFLPHVTWQPSDKENDYLNSTSCYIAKQNLNNVRPPMFLDITQPVGWYETLQPQSFDVIFNSNMIHISPWDTSIGLFRYAGHYLKPNGILFLYGPFCLNGVLAPESNFMFDKKLRSQDPSWGVRDTKDLEKLAISNGLKFENMVDMPANNKCLIYRKSSQ